VLSQDYFFRSDIRFCFKKTSEKNNITAMDARRIFQGGNSGEISFSQVETKRKQHFSAKELIEKCQISKSGWPRLLSPFWSPLSQTQC